MDLLQVRWDDLVDVWVPQLLNGTYQQGRNTLRDAKGNMCCLGVLYDSQGGEWRNYGNPARYYETVNASDSYLSEDDAGIEYFYVEKNKEALDNAELVQFFFGGMNDIAELTFRQIAGIVLYFRKLARENQSYSALAMVSRDWDRLASLELVGYGKKLFFESEWFKEALEIGEEYVEKYEAALQPKEEKEYAIAD